jgi:hypothetical protein
MWVWQGCPFLFNIFIKDLFDDMPYGNVVIPHGIWTWRKPVLPFLGLVRLLFADIALGLVANLEEICLLCTYITNWTNANDMKVNIGKCGIMEWGTNREWGHSGAFSLPNPNFDAHLVISGEPVPVINEYMYLRVTITCLLGASSSVHGYMSLWWSPTRPKSGPGSLELDIGYCNHSVGLAKEREVSPAEHTVPAVSQVHHFSKGVKQADMLGE